MSDRRDLHRIAAELVDFRDKNPTGPSGDQVVGDLTPDELYRLMGAQRRMEGWKPGAVGFLGQT